MPKIRLILQDDSGQQNEQTFAFEGHLDTLNAIYEAAEQYKNQILPKLEQELLHQSQKRLVVAEKKQALKSDSSNVVTVGMRHVVLLFFRRFITAQKRGVFLLPVHELSGCALLSEDTVCQTQATQYD